MQYCIGTATEQSFRYIELKVWISKNASLCRVLTNRVTYIDTFFMYHDTTLCCKDTDVTCVIFILNHVCYDVNADGRKDNGAGKGAEVKNPV